MDSNAAARRVGGESDDPATSRGRQDYEVRDTATSSGDEDVRRAKISQQQAKNDQLFVTIRKRLPESTIIQEIEGVLDAGAEINAFNAGGKTVVDVARQKRYARLEKYLSGRGGKAALNIDYGNDDDHQNIEVNNTNTQLSPINFDLTESKDKLPSSNMNVDEQRRILDAILKNETIHLTKDKLEELNTKLKSGLEIQEVKKALIRCGIDVNYQYSKTKTSAVDIAWKYGYYDAVLMLLEADSKFPKDFYDNFDEFYKNSNIPEKLKSFVRERQELHEWIQNDELNKIQKFMAVHPLSNFFNCKNKSALEVAAEFANVDTFACVIAVQLPAQEITISEEQRKLLKQFDTEGNTLLSISAKFGKTDIVDLLIRCGININYRNNFEESAVDLAWYNRYFDTVHMLLKADSDFPKEFNLDALNVTTAKRLRLFVERRNNLHKLIKENRLVEIKEFTATDKSTLYLNSDGESALVTAVISKRFEIYAFLKSKGIAFKDEDEKEYINKLPLAEKDALKTAMIREFPQVHKGHIFYLISKSRSKRPVDNFKERIENLYRRLDDIPEVSIILQVLQFIEYLDVVFDFDNENIMDINPTSSEFTKGLTEYKDGRIYIAARTDEAKLAGTLAHELTHLAMYVLYKNDCNPFEEVGYFRQKFTDITDTIRDKLKYIVDEMSGYEDNPVITLARAFKYPKHEQQSELIVRVPQILAQYSAVGRNFLVTCNVTKLLFNYYNGLEEGGLLYRCKEVIKNNFLIKLRKSILFFNETVGKIGDMIKYRVHFKSCIDFDNFLKSEKQVFLVETGSTLLSMLNIYDSLIVRNKNHSLCDSFLLEFDCYLEKEDEILQLLYSPAGKVLCVSYSSKSSKVQLSNALKTFKMLLNLKPDKKIIFIIQKSETEVLDKITSMFIGNCEKLTRHKFTFNDFTTETRKNLLGREIMLQKKSINLNKLIDISDDNAQKIIDTNILVKLIKGERIEVGHKPPDTSDLEGAYSQLFQEVDVNTFVGKLLEQNPREVYVFSGISDSNKEDSLINSIIHNIEGIRKLSEVDNLKSRIQVLDVQNVCRDITKNIQVTGDQFKAKHFKQICHNSSAMKIYWIHVRKEIGECKFILQQIYNPDFYVIGKRISREVVIEKRVVTELILSEVSESFIISMNRKIDFQQWLQLNSKQEIQFKRDIQNNKITLVFLQDDAEDYFPESVKANKTVHLLKFKEDHLVWYKTYGTLNTLIKYRAKDYKNIEPLIEEHDAINMIRNNKVSIIAGDPGTGKSTIIAWLCNTTFLSQCGQEESMIKSHWVIKINLKDHVETIKNMTLSNSDLREIADLLLQDDKTQSNDSTHIFARGLIGISMQKNNFKKPLLIAFDGFDEVLDGTVRNKIMKLLQYLKNNTYAKFCVMTRLHYEEDLEGALSTFAIKIEPMDSSTIRKFITKSFSNRLSLKLSRYKCRQCFDKNGKGMLKYINAFLSNMQEVFKNDITRFIGTPLQLYLLLENSIDSFLKWTEDSSKNPDFNFLGHDIWEVYENFVKKKYDYFCRTKYRKKDEKLHEEDLRNLDKYHKDLATSLIIKSEVKESLKNIQNFILSAGIVRSEANHLSFIHPTFAEYFAAKAFVHWIRKWRKKTHSGFINFEKQKYFFSEILRSSDYRVVRAFLNAKFLKEKFIMIELKTDYFDKIIVRQAINENHVGIAKFVLDSFPNVDVNDYDDGVGILNTAASKGHLELVKLLIEKGAKVNYVNRDGLTALYLAAESGHLAIVKLLIDEGAILNSLSSDHRKALHAAVRNGHLHIVTLLVDKGADFNVAFENGYDTALAIAARSGYLETVKWLIEKDANVNAVNNYGQTALHLATRSGHSKIVKLLIDEGSNINILDTDNRTALHEAIKNGNLEIVTLLLDTGANLNIAVDNELKTGLNIAAKWGHLNIIKLLIEKGANVNTEDRDGQTALYFASQSGYLEIVKALIGEGANVNISDHNDSTALYEAIKNGHIEIVKLLLDTGANLYVAVKNDYGTYLINKAATWGQLEIMNLLMKTGANVNNVVDGGRTALFIAAQSGYLEIVKTLVDDGANVNIVDHNDSTPLHEAIKFGHVEIVTLLLNTGADLNVAVEEGYETGLNRAAKWGQLEIIKLLIENGANVNAKDLRDWTALYLAVESGHLNVVKLLIDKGANVNIVSNDNKTALLAAVSYGYLDILMLLVDIGADFNIAFENGYGTALTMSAQLGHFDIVKWLIEKEADVDAVDNYGQTALYLAAESGRLEIVKLLIDKGANVNIVTKNKVTALYTAIKYKQLEIVTLLLNNGADCYVAFENGYDTALKIATVSGLLEIVKYLIGKGAKVNAVDVNGRTALHLAAEYGHSKIVKLLIDIGANVNMLDVNDRTALHEALEYWHIDIVTLLLDTGAYLNAAVGNAYEKRLISAAEWGQLEIIKFLMKKGANVNTVDHGGRTALYLAAQSGYLEIVKLLISEGANVNILDHDDNTALHVAIEFGHLEVVTLLLDTGADLNVAVEKGYKTGLNKAAKCGQLEIIKLLIEKGAKVDAVDVRDRTALYLATKFGHLNIVKLLIEEGANVNIVTIYNTTALCAAVQYGHLDIVTLLADKGADFKVAFKNGYNTALRRAATSGYFEIVKWLLDKDTNINALDSFRRTALYLATESRHLDIVKLLIDKGANVNVIMERKKTALFPAVRYGYLEITSLLVDKGADFQVAFENGYDMALIFAAVSGILETVNLFLEKGAKVNYVNPNGRTALYLAAEFGHLEIVKLLIDKGANVNVLDLFNRTALNVAFESGYFEIVTLLIKSGAYLNVAVKNGYKTALNVAAVQGKLEIIKCLIDNGAKVNATDVKGWTALYLAAKFGHLDIVKFLIDKGANVNIINKDDTTPLFAAIRYGHMEIVKLLVDNGSDVNVARKYSYTTLSVAARLGNLDIVKWLIDQGADVNAAASQWKTPLHSAVEAGNLEMIKLLIHKGANVNAIEDNGLTLLHRAICFASLKTVKCLVENGANMNALDKNQQTALFIAVKCQCLEIAQYLLEKTENLDIRDKNGKTVLHVAVECRCLQIVVWLVENGANVNLADNSGRTPCSLAAHVTASDIIKYLRNQK